MSTKNLPNPDTLLNFQLSKYEVTLVRVVASGANGIVYEGRQNIAGQPRQVAVKCIPLANLRQGWEAEIQKPCLLPPATPVVQPIGAATEMLPNTTEAFVFLVLPWIDGADLEKFARKNSTGITHTFCLALAHELLSVLHALQSKGIQHGDIKAANIIVEHPNETYGDDREHFWITDFGVGGSRNDLEPQDDFAKVGVVLAGVIRKARKNQSDPHSRYALDILEEWLLPRLAETDASSPHYRKAREFREYVRSIPSRYPTTGQRSERLETPFDYMSCEQLGDQYTLLQRLGSLNFPNCPEFLERSNTVLTGPRGCGKTTILRSLSTKHRVLGGTPLGQSLDRLSIYYHCTDLFYVFPYMRRRLDEAALRATVHYFDLSLLWETLDTLRALSTVKTDVQLTPQEMHGFSRWVRDELGLSTVASTDVLEELKAQVAALRKVAKTAFDKTKTAPDGEILGLDFVPRMVEQLRVHFSILKNTPTYILLDDYSTPRVSRDLQASLNRVVFQRSPELFFKVATESIVSLHQYDSDEKLLETEREFTVIDLGISFMKAEQEEKARFLEEVFDRRFVEAKDYELPKLRALLGTRAERTQVEIAEKIRSGSQYQYHGIDTVIDMCSGDVTHILHLVRDIITNSGGLPQYLRTSGVQPTQPVSSSHQNSAIQKLGGDFVASVSAAPLHGPVIAKIVQAFGQIAHWELVNLDSPNEGSSPPKQSFRIELKEELNFAHDEQELRETYDALVRYGVFIRDVTGKSQRSAVVPRLYLRRLLIPRFRLTFSKRDNVGMEVREFKELLREPDKMVGYWRSKKAKSARQLELPKGGSGNDAN